MKKILQIAWREFSTTVLTKSFLIGILLVPAIMAVMIAVVPLLLKNDAPHIEGHVVIVDPSGKVASTLSEQLSPVGFAQRRLAQQQDIRDALPEKLRDLSAAAVDNELLKKRLDEAMGKVPSLIVDTVEAGNLDAAKDGLRNEGQLAVIAIDPDAVTASAEGGKLGSYQLYVREKLDSRLIDELRDAVKASVISARFAERQMDADEAVRLTKVAAVTPVVVSKDGEKRSSDAARELMPMAFLFLIFLGVMTGGQQLMTSTIEEKSSRVVELLLAAVSPTELMAGKILGQFLAGGLLVLIYGGMGVAALASLAMLGLLDPWLLFYTLIFFVIAFMMLASLMAAIGAAVNELREAQSLLSPVMLVLVLPMMLWPLISRAPDSGLAVALSLIPPINPFVMILRMATNTPPPLWQVWLSIGIGIASAFAAVWFAGKVFRVGLLMHGKPPNFRTLWRWVRMS
jgi:ABC-type Na+ efflux pump permease subunit